MNPTRLLLLAVVLASHATGQGLNLPYATDHPSQVLDWYLPYEPGPPGPVVIYIHGGPGDKAEAAPVPGKLPDLLLRNGITVLAINIHPHPEFQYPTQLQDAAAAVQHVRANAGLYGIDPSRLAIWGVSSGAILGGWLTYGPDLAVPGGTPMQQQSTQPQVLLNEAGLMNFLLMSPWFPSLFPGGTIMGDFTPAFLKSVSVSEMVLDVPRPFTPPVLSYYGLEENPPPLVNPHDATLMKDLHHKLEAFPEAWAASMMVQKHPGSGIIIPDKLAAWLLPALGISRQVDVGWALPGTGGIAPELEATGAWSPGGLARLGFRASVAASTPVWIVAGSLAANLPFKGGKLIPTPDFPIALQTGSDGTLELDLVLPGTLVPGQAFYLQALQPDAGAPQGMALSNAVYATLSP
jgi:hypothetical protein